MKSYFMAIIFVVQYPIQDHILHLVLMSETVTWPFFVFLGIDIFLRARASYFVEYGHLGWEYHPSQCPFQEAHDMVCPVLGDADFYYLR